ncbi:hypothetical protein MKW92_003266 [Papaver armeniacum]|nr:hypothetical protein MKW92_003266 [Papaver armeniacum]
MAKSISSSKKIQQIAKITSEKLINHSKQPKPKSLNEFLKPETSKSRVDFDKLKSMSSQNRATTPLSRVVSSSKDGDSGKQVLVSQMYYNGYGIPKDVKKGRAWIAKASRNRSSMVWEVRNKQPGYNASDSDSDKLKEENDAK